MCSRMKFAPTFINSTASSALRPLEGLTEACDGVPSNVNFADTSALELPDQASFLVPGCQCKQMSKSSNTPASVI